MDIFHLPLETIYLYTLIIAGSLTLLILFFQDVFHGLSEAIPVSFVNPTLILSFLTIFSASGYIGEIATSLSNPVIALLSFVLSVFLVSLLYFFILVPLSSAEESLVYRESDLKGRIGRVITSVPKDGYGEVIIEGIGGAISKSAVSFDQEQIKYGTAVLVIDVKDGVLFVTPHEPI
ncbi:NfeD family protein [Bacillus sp. 1021]|uniref:NfeD family protein n=1 Tax=Bacillus TaxID=1386 RepID=UPI0003136DD7|nr:MULTISPECIES: NfeD family protein [Bacillus]MBD0407794.1 NfeD family protein [Bacillus sp. 1021]MED0771404.1 NfeD family protein [Bacillus siamensis]MED0774105.1 NfeD family protein [Bacillus siamensis]MED0779039.1 NfeD family protein [Bacillus siamensis]MED0833626.1 NfeD family protein [Bacillus siamensis]